jgi:hypothetical protein
LTGTYTVLVANNSSSSSATGNYTLTLAKTPGPYTVSPGDEGGSMTNGASHTGSIPTGDLDAWSFQATANDGIAVSLGEVGESNSEFYPWLRLVGPDGATLGNYSGNTTAEIAVRAPLTGTYTVLVANNSSSSSATGNYTLTLAKTPGPYTVSPGDEGGPMTNGASHTGSIPTGDLDAWSFQATAKDNLVISLSEVGGSNPEFYPWLRLVGPDGATLGNYSANTTAEITVQAPLTGTYTVLVANNSSSSSATGNYTLTVSGLSGGTGSTGTLTGTARDSVTSAAISGASVSFNGSSATTNTSGVYTLPNLACASSTLTVSKSGYTTASIPYSLTTCPGTSTKDVALTPTTPVSPVVTTFSAAPSTINAGQSSTLSWTTTNATAVAINGVSATLAPNSSVPVSPASTTTYTLTAIGAGGTATRTTTVTVNPVSQPTCQLSVVKQSQLDWNTDLYDHSNKFFISEKGCALTALSMALNFAGMNFTPPSLNLFMITHSTDYIGLGVNWDKATRDASGAAFLKFFSKRLSGQTGLQYLDKEVCQNGHPVIVGVNLDAQGVPGHFVLVTGKSGTEFSIADPGSTHHLYLSDYPSLFETRGYVADPPGDISVLDVGISDAAEFMVTDPFGRRNGVDATTGTVVEEIENSAYFRDAMIDDVTLESPTEVARIAVVAQPVAGRYQVSVVGTKLGVYTLSVSGFSKDGSPQPPSTVPGIAAIGSTNTLSVQFDPSSPAPRRRAVKSNAFGEEFASEDELSSLVVQRVATFQDTIADVENGLSLGLLDDAGVAASLVDKLRAAQGAVDPTRREFIRLFMDEVAGQAGKHIGSTAVQILLIDGKSLLQ